MSPMVKCDNPACGKEFERNSWRLKRSKLHFCSNECRKEYYLKIKINCKNCGKEFEVPFHQKNRKFCSRDCYCFFEFGTIIEKGKRRLLPNRIVSTCYMKEARAILEGKNWRGKNKCTKLIGD